MTKQTSDWMDEALAPLMQNKSTSNDWMDEALGLSQPAANPQTKPPERTLIGTLGDIGIAGAKSVLGTGEALVGLADLPTIGYAGKLLHDTIGYDPKEAQAMLSAGYSDAQKAANQRVEQAKGFLPTLAASLENPSTIATAVGESLGPMLLGGGISKGLGLAAKYTPYAGAIGEGLVGAGSAAEQIRQESPDQALSAKGLMSAIGSGVGTGLLGAVGGKAANALGIGDIETALAGKALREVAGDAPKRNILSRILGGAVSEGVLEELPQSVQEQMWQNYATDKPLLEGVPESAARGLLAGVAMGGVFNAMPQQRAPVEDKTDDKTGDKAPAIDGKTIPTDAELDADLGVLDPAMWQYIEGVDAQPLLGLTPANEQPIISGPPGSLAEAAGTAQLTGAAQQPAIGAKAPLRNYPTREDAQDYIGAQAAMAEIVAKRRAAEIRQQASDLRQKATAMYRDVAEGKLTQQALSPAAQAANTQAAVQDNEQTELDSYGLRAGNTDAAVAPQGVAQENTQLPGSQPALATIDPAGAAGTGDVAGKPAAALQRPDAAAYAGPTGVGNTAIEQGNTTAISPTKTGIAEGSTAIDRIAVNANQAIEPAKPLQEAGTNQPVAPQQTAQQPGAVQPDQSPALTALLAQYEAAKAAGDNATMRALAPLINAEKAAPAKEANKAPPAKASKPFSVGTTPGNAQAVTIRDGVVHIGGEPAYHYETGEEVRMPKGSTQAEVLQAIKDAGAITNKAKPFNLDGGAKLSTVRGGGNAASFGAEHTSTNISDSGTAEKAVAAHWKLADIFRVGKQFIKSRRSVRAAWLDAVNSIPFFMGGKRKLAGAAMEYISGYIGKDAGKFTAIEDMFGGSGSFGMTLAETVLPNVKSIQITEFDAVRKAAIEWRIHKDDLRGIYQRNKSLIDSIYTDVIKGKSASTKSISPAESGMQAYAAKYGRDITSSEQSRELAVFFKSVVDRMFSGRTIGGNGEMPLLDRLRYITDVTIQESDAQFEQANRLKERGVTINIRGGSSYEANLPSQSTFVVADPPYYGTEGYHTDPVTLQRVKSKVGKEIYEATRDLLDRLKRNGNSVLYTDEAWWTKGKTDRSLSDQLAIDGKPIYDRIRNTVDHITVVPIAKRLETLAFINGANLTGINDGYQQSGNDAGRGTTGRNSGDVSETGAGLGTTGKSQSTAGTAEEPGRLTPTEAALEARQRAAADKANARKAEAAKARQPIHDKRTVPTRFGDTEAVRQVLEDTAAEVVRADELNTESKSGSELSRQQAQFITQIARLFKKRVVFFRSTKGTDGYFQGDSNTIYLNTRSSVAQLRVLGHELTHAMKQQAGDAYNTMLQSVSNLLTDTELSAQFKDYFSKELTDTALLDTPMAELADVVGEQFAKGNETLRDFLAEEWLSDLSGNRFAESGFWNELFQDIEARHGNSVARNIINRLRMAFNNALNKILQVMKGGEFAVDQRLQDHLLQIRQAVKDGFVAYEKAAKAGQLQDGNGVKFGAKYSFAGRAAATADKHALKTAQQRLANGEDRETVRKETGWFKGLDKKWRFEISDKDASLTDKAWGKIMSEDGDNTIRLGDALNHPALFAAYPAIADYAVVFVDGQLGSANGNFSDDVITIERGNTNIRSILLHEIQHGIQDIEGFASGGSTRLSAWTQPSARRALLNEVKKSAKERTPPSYELYWGKEHTKEGDIAYEKFLKEWKSSEYQRKLDIADQHGAPARIYPRLAGEVEARNTQTRLTMSAEERRNTSPSQTADVADSDVIVIYNGKVMENAPTPENAKSEKISREAKRKVLRDIFDQNAESFDYIQPTLENWRSIFGNDQIVTTPIGEVKVSNNQFAKMSNRDNASRGKFIAMIRPTLERPILVTHKDSNVKVFMKSFIDKSKVRYFASIVVTTGGMDVSISNTPKDFGAIFREVIIGTPVYDPHRYVERAAAAASTTEVPSDGGLDINIASKESTTKRSTVRTFGNTRVIENPMRYQAENMLAKSQDKVLRGVRSEDGTLYLWDAYDAHHNTIIKHLGEKDSNDRMIIENLDDMPEGVFSGEPGYRSVIVNNAGSTSVSEGSMAEFEAAMRAMKKSKSRLNSNEVQADPGNRKNYRNSVLLKARNLYQKPIEAHAPDGKSVIVAWGGVRHGLNSRVPTWQESIAALHIKQLLEDSEYYDTKLDKHGRKDPSSTSRYVTGALFDDEPYKVVIFTRKHSDGHRYYDHVVVEKINPAGHLESERDAQSASDATPTHPYAGFTESIAKKSTARVFGDITAAQEQALRNTGLMTEPKTWKQRWAEFKTDLGKRIQTGLVDQFAPIKALDQQAYIAARLSKGSDGLLEAMMLYGKPFMNNGVPDVKVGQEGFAHVLAKLGNEQDRFFAWVAAQRAERLAQHGLENLFSQGDINALKTLNLGDAKNPNRAKLYSETLQQLNDFNDAVLAIAEASGIIDAKARQMFKDVPYVPFYRVMEDGVQGPTMSSGMVNQYAWKKLKGGNAKLNEDLIANTLQNWAHLFSAAAKNRASLATMDAANKVQIAEQVPSGTKGAVKILRNGVTEHWLISDPYIAEAVSAMEYVAPQWFRPFATAKRWLTAGVTFSPVFKIRNLIRDSISAIGHGELSYNPMANVAQGLKAYRFGSQTHASMLAGGGSIHFGTAEDSGQLRKQIRKWSDEGTYLDESGWKKFSHKLVDLYDAYQELGDKSENANRAALYEQLLKKGYSQQDALFMSRDLLDFSMSGRWPVVRFLAQTVPFLNARLQGLYKLGRAAQDNPARMGYVVGAVVMASLALMLGYEDDDWWKQREDWDRDANWAFKVGDIVIRIPKPFEIGSIGTVAERSWELFFNKEMGAKRYGKRISDIFLQTFSMNPVPQAIKPFADVYANQDAFSGKPIETMGLERLRPEDRKTNRTTTVAEFLGMVGLPDPAQLMMGRYRALSPVQMDYLARAYFGWTGTAALTVVDQLTRPMLGRGDRPEGTLKDTFLLGNFASDTTEGGSSRYVTAMYDQAKDIEQAYASYRDALKRGDSNGAAEIMAEEKDKIVKYKMVENQKKLISTISQRIKMVEAMPNLSGEAKRAQIIKLEQTRNQIAQRMAGA